MSAGDLYCRGFIQWATRDPYAGVRRVARKHIRQPGVCEEYLRWVLGDGPEPNFPECRCDDCT